MTTEKLRRANELADNIDDLNWIISHLESPKVPVLSFDKDKTCITEETVKVILNALYPYLNDLKKEFETL